MNQDYFIDDQDGYNWVTLSKPLSSYTKEELAETLIKNKKDTGATQKIRIAGKIGAVLNTDGCDTPEEFLQKYNTVLDRAGFNNGEVKEEPKPLTIKPKSLSKVSFMDYTQEELAHLIMDDKINNPDGTEYGIYEHRETVFDSTGCNTIEDFINKYQEEFRKRRIKAADGTLPKKEENPVSEEIKPNNITKDGIRIITIPLGVINYTQEDLAHLVMDNKKDNEEVGIKINGVLFDSTGCATVEDFINKHEKVATNLGIKHNYSEKLAAVGNIIDMPSNLNTFKLDESKIEAAKEAMPEIEKEEAIKEKNLEVEEIPAITTQLVPLLQDMISQKQVKKKEILADYKGNVISTQDCNSIAELVNKYQNLVDMDRKTEVNNLLKNREIEKATVLFNIPRGNYYNGTDVSEQSKTEIIHNKNKEYAKILSSADKVDFTNSEVAYNWLNKLVPYINTHALNLNLGSDASLNQADQYLLQFMESKGYNSDLANPHNYETYEKYQITKKLNELNEYHFFISDYSNLAKEDLDLNSSKTNAMAEISYLENKVSRGTRGLALIAQDLASVKTKAKLELSRLESNMSIIDQRILLKGDSQFEAKATTEDEIAANKAYMLASFTFEVSDIEKAVSAINELPESSSIKAGLMDATYKLFNSSDATKNANDPDMIEKEKICSQIAELNKEKEDVELRLNRKQSQIIEAITFVNSKISQLRVENNLMYYLKDNTDEKVEEQETKPEEDFDLSVDKSKEESMTIEESTSEDEAFEYDFSLDDEEYDLSLPDMQDSIKDFVPIKSFKQISKELYDKINFSKVKQVIKKAVDKLKENKKAALVYAGFAAAIAITVAAAGHINTHEQPLEENVSIETSIDNQEEEELEKETSIVEEDRLATNTSKAKITSVNAEEPEYLVSLDEAAKETLDQVLEGKEEVYNSFEDATQEVNGMSAESLYMPSWQNANNGDYYVEKDGVMNKLTPEEAEDYYQNGQNLVQSVENDGTVIGYVNIENDNAGKSM